tara:strand:- start:2427 stop:3035 length:609 start_codon:yes stop_codon:yes gene_type:complete
MAFYVTDGTTARQQNTGVVFVEGKVTTGTSHVDIRYDQARTAGYGFFILDLTGIRHESKEFTIRGLTAANTPGTNGHYGGYYNHGETDGTIDSSTSSNMSNQAYWSLTGGRTGNHGSRYLGNWRIYMTFPVDSSITDVNGSRPNIWWRGTDRTSSILSANIAGGGTAVPSFDYGIRVGTDDGSANWDLGSYCLTGYKEGGQF